CVYFFFFFSSRRRHTRSYGDWSSDVCSSDLARRRPAIAQVEIAAHQDGCPDGREISGAHGIPGDLDPFRLRERPAVDLADDVNRSEERRVGKECRSRWAAAHSKKKQ